MIVEKVLEAKERNIKQWPVKSNRASELGHECLRYLVLNRTRWQEKAVHDVRLQMIFDMGRIMEDAVYLDLREAGITIVEQQRPFSWDKYNITGHIDCKLAVNGGVYPCEIKSAAPYAFESVNSVQDMLKHKYAYMRRYPAQLTLYLLMDNKDRGLFLFINKSTGALKEIWLDVDYDLGESLIQKALSIEKHIAGGTLPDPIDYREDMCGECAFAHICMPDRIGKEVEVIDNDELLELIARYMELKAGVKEFEATDKRINEIVKGREKLLIGDYFVSGKWQSRTSYDVPEELKQAYKRNTEYWKKEIARV